LDLTKEVWEGFTFPPKLKKEKKVSQKRIADREERNLKGEESYGVH